MLKLVVRLSTDRYMSGNRLVETRTLRLLKRKSTGSLYDLFFDPEYELSGMGLYQYSDGVYQVKTCNHSYDIESGVLDDFDLELIPYKEVGV